MRTSSNAYPFHLYSTRQQFAAALTLVIGASLACLLPLNTARAAFHLWDINEVYSNPDGTVQFIELRALFGSQEFLAGSGSIQSTNSNGVNTFTCPTNLPGDTANKFLILGTSNLASIPGGVIPNYIIPANFIRPPVGGGKAAVIYVPNSATATASYTSLPTDGDSALLRSGSSFIVVPTNSARNFSDQSNTIVPVKFLTANQADTNFVMSFRTATGPNGSAGPNYGVEFKNEVTNGTWTSLADIAGDGTTKSVSNAISSSPQRIFRLRVP